MKVSSKPGELHTVKVKDIWYVGTYASVWFDGPNEYTVRNREIPDAPAYYIEFVWKKQQSFEMDKNLLTYWLKKRLMFSDVDGWRSSYHIKHFYQAVVTEVDGKGVDKKYMEVWTEANWNKDTDEFKKIECNMDVGEMKVISGLEQYRWLPFRIVGVGAEKPLGGWPILILSNFKFQYRRWCE